METYGCGKGWKRQMNLFINDDGGGNHSVGY